MKKNLEQRFRQLELGDVVPNNLNSLSEMKEFLLRKKELKNPEFKYLTLDE